MKYRILKHLGDYFIQKEIEFTPYYPLYLMPVVLLWFIFDRSVLADKKKWIFIDGKTPYKSIDDAKQQVSVLSEPDEIMDL